MRKNWNLTLAFFTAPLISATLSVLLTPIATSQGLVTALGIFGIFYMTSTIVLVLFGIPLYCFFLCINKVNWKTCLGSGFLAGLIVGLFLQYPSDLRFKELAELGIVGSISALGFWFVLRVEGNRSIPKDR